MKRRGECMNFNWREATLSQLYCIAYDDHGNLQVMTASAHSSLHNELRKGGDANA